MNIRGHFLARQLHSLVAYRGGRTKETDGFRDLCDEETVVVEGKGREGKGGMRRLLGR